MSALMRLLHKAVANLVRAEINLYTITNSQQHGLPQPKDYGKYVAQYLSWIYTCVNIVALATARTPLRLYAKKAPRNFPVAEVEEEKRIWLCQTKTLAADDAVEVLDHPLLTLLKKVNPQENQYEFLELTSVMLDLTGNAYWYIPPGPLGPPVEMFLLRSQWVKIVPDLTNFLKGYVFGKQQDQLVRFDADEVIHFKLANPHDAWYGMGPVEASVWAAQRRDYMDRYDNALLSNMGQPGGILRPAKDANVMLTETQRRDLERKWNQAYGGPDKAGKTHVASGPMEFERTQLSPREMEFVQGRAWTMKELCGAFNVPEGLVSKEANRANAEQAEFVLCKYAVAPRCRRLEEKLNERLVPLFDENLFLAFDDPVPANVDQQLRQEDTWLRNKVVTVNEVRGTHGMEPVEWGDEPNQPAPTPFGAGGEEEQEAGARKKPEKHVHKAAGQNPPLSKEEEQYRGAVRGLWRRQKASLLHAMGTRRAKAPAGMAGDEQWWAAVEEWLEDGEKWVRQTVEVVGPLRNDSFRRSGNAALRKLGVEIPEWIAQPHVIEYLRTQTLDFAKRVQATTESRLRDELLAGMKDGEGIYELRKRIEDVYAGWDRDRSEMIARTESARANSGGRIAAWKEAGITEKEWSAADDCCAFCQEMDGKRVPIDENYFDKGELMDAEFDGRRIEMDLDYADVEGPPLHPNCRCALVEVVPEL